MVWGSDRINLPSTSCLEALALSRGQGELRRKVNSECWLVNQMHDDLRAGLPRRRPSTSVAPDARTEQESSPGAAWLGPLPLRSVVRTSAGRRACLVPVLFGLCLGVEAAGGSEG